MDRIERLKRELVHEGAIINIYRDKIKLPDGNIVNWDFIGHKGAAAVIPVTEEGKLLMVKQYRNAIDRVTIEIPAGGRDSVNEPTLTCASRELEEETGYHSDNLEFLISVSPTVAYGNEKIDIYVARNLKKTKQHLDEGEYIDVYEYSVDELVKLILSGIIQDSKTISGILAYKTKYLD